jgi:hypothetical protein
MYRFDADMIYGNSILYKDDKKVEEIKKINNHLTILYFLENENNHQEGCFKMTDILKNSTKNKK